MTIPDRLYDSKGDEIWDLEDPEYRQDFTERQNIRMIERDLMLGDSEDFRNFKELMDEPIDGKRYECEQPLQIRIMGSLNEVREMSQKILNMLDAQKNNKLKAGRKTAYTWGDKKTIPTYTSGTIGLSKLECDKRDRTGKYCSNTIRAYLNPQKYPSRASCESVNVR
jgi:hypothetical protein